MTTPFNGKRKVAVYVKDGMVQDIYSDADSDELEVEVIDLDITDPEELDIATDRLAEIQRELPSVYWG